MGRFETTAAAYAARREPYPAAFFAAAAERLGLTGREALIDLGAGPGLLALGFAPYVGRLVGVDPEPAMVAAAREAAAAAAIAFDVRLGRAEDVGAELGAFDLVTIGRALHWMEREPTLAALERMLAPGGRILVCGSRMGAANPWRSAFERVTQAFSSGGEAGYRRAHEEFFTASRFAPIADLLVAHRQPVDVETLVERALTRSTTSPAALGDRIDAFRAQLRQALAPFLPDGEAEEVIEAKARIYARGVGQVSDSR
jgi:ubiquinone/menaquinone biosynthesis C-methylase UbiE